VLIDGKNFTARVAKVVCVGIFRFVVVLSVLRKEFRGQYMFMVGANFYFEHADNPHKECNGVMA
jgi:hypothetical protein